MTVPSAVLAAETDADRAAARDLLHRLKEKLDNLSADVRDLAAALASPGKVAELATGLIGERDADEPGDEDEPYCCTCGSPVGIFHGHSDSWRHWRGRGTAQSPVELYDAGHEPEVAWRPAGAR